MLTQTNVSNAVMQRGDFTESHEKNQHSDLSTFRIEESKSHQIKIVSKQSICIRARTVTIQNMI